MGARRSLQVVVVAILVLFAASCGRNSSSKPAIVIEKQGDLYAVAIDGSRTVRLTSTPADERAPAVSFDGRKIAFVRELHTYDFLGEIWTMNVDGTHRTRVTRGGEGDWGPAWSPDGKTIYFVRYVRGVDGEICGAIFRVDASGRNLRRVISPPHHLHSFVQPAVSPDGRRIAFDDWNGCSGGTSSLRLRVIDPSGHPTSDLARLPHNGYYPDPEHGSSTWSPDGRRIAFILNGRLSIANRDGSEVRSAAPSWLQIADAWTHPAWSPDGNWIAVVDGNGVLYVVHPDGTGLRSVARNSWWGDSPAWLPGLPK
jgi:Tol biopolymer transport system component